MAEKMKNVSVDYSTMKTSAIVNTVRAAFKNGESATGIDFETRIPQCNRDNLNVIGEIFDGDSDLANAFLKEVFNRIGLVDMNYRRYTNQLKQMKRGRLEFGETIEEVAFGIVKGLCDYDVQEGVSQVFQITLPEVAAALHKVNYQQKYPISITRADLRKAFTSESSLGSFIDGVMTSLYNSYEIDEQLAYKNLMKVAAEGGFLLVEEMAAVTDEATGKALIKSIKALATKMMFMSRAYSKYGLPQFTPKSDLLIILDADTDASISVDVLAAAFNMSETDFINSGIKIVIDEFPVEGMHAIVCDKRLFQIYDNDFSLDSIYNPANRVWNYFLHVWEIISASPFMQGVVYVEPGAGSVAAVAVTPTAATVAKGKSQAFKAAVTIEGVASMKVSWNVTGATSQNTSISPTGILTVGADETAATLTVKAISVQDSTKTADATVTVQA